MRRCPGEFPGAAVVLADLLHGGPRAGPVAGSLARRKRWPARIFHPRSRTPSAPKWRNDAIPRSHRSRRTPESHAPATFFRPVDAPGRNGGAAGGLHRARAVIGTGPAATAGVASWSPRGNHRTVPGPARVSRIRADAESAAPARGGAAPPLRPDGASRMVGRRLACRDAAGSRARHLTREIVP